MDSRFLDPTHEVLRSNGGNVVVDNVEVGELRDMRAKEHADQAQRAKTLAEAQEAVFPHAGDVVEEVEVVEVLQLVAGVAHDVETVPFQVEQRGLQFSAARWTFSLRLSIWLLVVLLCTASNEAGILVSENN